MSDAPERIWAFYAPHISEDENGATIVAYETVQHGAAEYVRANMQPTVSPDVAALVDALEFYRGAWKCKPNKRYGGMEWSPKEVLLDDCGNIARATLAEIKGESHE